MQYPIHYSVSELDLNLKGQAALYSDVIYYLNLVMGLKFKEYLNSRHGWALVGSSGHLGGGAAAGSNGSVSDSPIL